MLKQLTAWLAVLVAVAGISAALGLYKRNELMAARSAASAGFEASEAVASTRAKNGEWSATTRSIGTVVAIRQLELRNEIAGVIAEMGFKSGQIVDKGQMLVQFDVRQEKAVLAAVEAEARLAKLTLDRRESLRNSAAFSPQEFDKAREDFAAATARASNLQVAIDKKRISAPFRARIGITNLQPGAYLDVATMIAMLQGVDPDAFVDFTLPQDSAAFLHAGSVVKVSAAGVPDGSAKAEIAAEDDSVDRANRTVRFRAIAKGLGDKLRPGMFVDVMAVTAPARATVLAPLAAIRRSPSGQHVFVLVTEGGKLRARQREVVTGAVVDQDIAIEKGLEAGELIAASGSFKLRDGALVSTEAPAQTPETTVAN